MAPVPQLPKTCVLYQQVMIFVQTAQNETFSTLAWYETSPKKAGVVTSIGSILFETLIPIAFNAFSSEKSG
jgi:hypothetical protein